MYLSFYGFTQKPFQDNTHLDFLWLGESRKDALARFRNGILNAPGIFLLTGDIGTGKTILSNELIRSLGEEVAVSRVPDPGLEIVEFLNCIADAFAMNRTFAARDDFYSHFSHFIKSVAETGKKLLLVMDECQRLRPDLLEEIVRLAGIDRQEPKTLSIFLIGQNELNDILQHHDDGNLHRRIGVSYAIPALNLDETGAFIHHRLKIAGAKENIFAADAIDEIYAFSEGIPRKINIICDHALLSGFIKETKIINGGVVRECGRYFNPPDISKKTDDAPGKPVVHSNAEIFDEEPQQEREKMHVPSVWATVSTIVLIILGVFFLTYILHPHGYESLISRVQKSSAVFFDSPEETKSSPVDPSQQKISGKSVQQPSGIQPPEEEGVLDTTESRQASSAKLEPMKETDQAETSKGAAQFQPPQSSQDFVAEPEEKVANDQDNRNDFQIYSRLKERMIQKIKDDQALQSAAEDEKGQN